MRNKGTESEREQQDRGYYQDQQRSFDSDGTSGMSVK